MSAVLDALEVLKTHIVPSEEKLQQYRDAINRHCDEKSSWRQRAETAEKQVATVTAALNKLGYNHPAYTIGELGYRVECAITESRRNLEHELKKARELWQARDRAREDLRHHATCLCKLYNKAAGHVLFKLGAEPDLFEIRTAIDAAIEAAVQERLNTMKETT